ncbi:MAG: metal-dependent hydrolase [Syntrophales bacterium LBB04]|nr:metal-dependent hydrolase [Syntrophales bacterium LBB04]
MPSPIGHGIIGLAVYAGLANQENRSTFLTKKEIVIGLLCSYAPDLDFLPGLITGKHFQFHHGLTHSLIFGIVLGGILSLLLGRFRPETFWKGAGIYSLLVWIHVVLDGFIVDNRPLVAHGLRIFYPFSDITFKSPIDIFFLDLGIKGSIHPRNIFIRENLLPLFLEIVVAITLSALLYALIKFTRKRFNFRSKKNYSIT